MAKLAIDNHQKYTANMEKLEGKGKKLALRVCCGLKA